MSVYKVQTSLNTLLIIYIVYLVIYFRPDFDNYLDEFTAVYILYGAQIGHTTLQAQAQPQTGIVRSQSKPIEVDKNTYKITVVTFLCM
jgi:hypothetical protein